MVCVVFVPPKPGYSTIYATNKDGKNAFIAVSSLIASAGIHASVSNSQPHFEQDQRLMTSRSLTYSDHSGAISFSPHFSQVVPKLELDVFDVMATSLALLLKSSIDECREFENYAKPMTAQQRVVNCCGKLPTISQRNAALHCNIV